MFRFRDYGLWILNSELSTCPLTHVSSGLLKARRAGQIIDRGNALGTDGDKAHWADQIIARGATPGTGCHTYPLAAQGTPALMMIPPCRERPGRVKARRAGQTTDRGEPLVHSATYTPRGTGVASSDDILRLPRK